MGNAVKEARRITIVGDLVCLERTVIERTAMAADFMAEIARTQPMETGLLPEGCVLLSRVCDEGKRTRTIYVIERPAGMQRIQYNTLRGGHEFKELVLSWPRTVWFCRTSQAPSSDFASIQDFWVTATRSAIHEEGHATPLFCLPMPNIYESGNGSICMGNLTLEDNKAPNSVRITALLRQVLESAWNSDLLPSFEGMSIASLEDWAQASEKEPEFHTRLELKRHLYGSVSGMLKHLTETPG